MTFLVKFTMWPNRRVSRGITIYCVIIIFFVFLKDFSIPRSMLALIPAEFGHSAKDFFIDKFRFFCLVF